MDRKCQRNYQLTVWRSHCLMLPCKVLQRQTPSSCAIRQVNKSVNPSKLSWERTAWKWMRATQLYLVRAGTVSFHLNHVFINFILRPNHFSRVLKCRAHYKVIDVKLAYKADWLSVHFRVQIATKSQNSRPRSRRLTSRISFSHKPLSSEIHQIKSWNPRDRVCVTPRVWHFVACIAWKRLQFPYIVFVSWRGIPPSKLFFFLSEWMFHETFLWHFFFYNDREWARSSRTRHTTCTSCFSRKSPMSSTNKHGKY